MVSLCGIKIDASINILMECINKLMKYIYKVSHGNPGRQTPSDTGITLTQAFLVYT